MQAAGVETHFSEFVRHARVSNPQFAHGWLNAAGEMHRFVADRVEGELAHVIVCRCLRDRRVCAPGIAAANSPQRAATSS
jgi:hypothetical protein